MVSPSSSKEQGKNRKEKGSFPIGCVLISSGFLLFGAFFLVGFFAGFRSRGPGNPKMALVFGTMFALLGLGGLAAWVLSLLNRRR
jgi:hypothetical protein